MGLLKILLIRRAEGCRKAIRLSYDKDVRLAREGLIPVDSNESLHTVGLYGSLGSRYEVSGESKSEVEIWAELGPFLLMNEAAALEALSEYVVYKEQPGETRMTWLKNLINDTFRMSSISERTIRFVGGVINRVAWCDLLDSDILRTIEEEVQNFNSDFSEDVDA